MKNKESKRPSTVGKNKSRKTTQQSVKKPTGPSKTQLERLKKFYNTTRWLPNSAFTTYFGKPAFENYGYGNTNPVYGGLFYGNYMLSHNMNPIDGDNHPPEKQVYSSAMMKSLQRQAIRRPSPPRKKPDEIRNTPEELQEINTRKQIFQLPNECPSREIIPPNLLKCQCFKSGKNSPVNSEDENEDEYEVFNVENALSGKKNKKKKIDKNKNANFDPYKQGKIQLGKKKMKEGLDNKIDEDALLEKVKLKKRKKLGLDDEEEEEEEIDEETQAYNVKKRFYEEMLGEDGLKNLEDLRELQIETKEKAEEKEKQKIKEKEEEAAKLEAEKSRELEETKEERFKEENTCPLCGATTQSMTKFELLRKKDNPALYPPNHTTGFSCCAQHSKDNFSSYKYMDPYYAALLPAAGRPTSKNEPLNLFK